VRRNVWRPVFFAAAFLFFAGFLGISFPELLREGFYQGEKFFLRGKTFALGIRAGILNSGLWLSPRGCVRHPG